MPEAALPSDAVWDDLTFSEQFLLWAIRMWAQLSDDPVRAHDFIAPAFERVGVPGAGASFHSFMCGITAAARRRIEVRCPRATEICRDERGLLHALHACQRNRPDAAHVQLAAYVHEDAVRHVMTHASLLMRACLRGGVLLRPAEETALPHPLAADHDDRVGAPRGVTIH